MNYLAIFFLAWRAASHGQFARGEDEAHHPTTVDLSTHHVLRQGGEDGSIVRAHVGEKVDVGVNFDGSTTIDDVAFLEHNSSAATGKTTYYTIGQFPWQGKGGFNLKKMFKPIKMGSGQFGTAYVVEREGDGKHFVWKRLTAEAKEDDQYNWKNIAKVAEWNVPFACAPVDMDPIVIKHRYNPMKRASYEEGYITELFDGDLFEFIQNNDELATILGSAETLIAFINTFIVEMFAALKVFEDNGWQHMDVKPANILIKHRRPAGTKSPIDFYLTDFDGMEPLRGEVISGTESFMDPAKEWGGLVVAGLDYYPIGVIVEDFVATLEEFHGAESVPAAMKELVTVLMEPKLAGCSIHEEAETFDALGCGEYPPGTKFDLPQSVVSRKKRRPALEKYVELPEVKESVGPLPTGIADISDEETAKIRASLGSPDE